MSPQYWRVGLDIVGLHEGSHLTWNLCQCFFGLWVESQRTVMEKYFATKFMQGYESWVSAFYKALSDKH